MVALAMSSECSEHTFPVLVVAGAYGVERVV